MSKIRNLHDSFLHFLADNLAGIPVRELLFDKDDDTSNVIQTNALNVHFLNTSYANVSTVLVTLDVAHDDALTGRDWEESISHLLQATAFTEVVDHSDPANPVTVPQAMISWPSKLSFRTVVSDSYFHSTATITLTYS